MKWEKKGLIYCPDGKCPWAKKYAFPPTPYFVADDVIRIYVAFCDENMVGRIGFVDISAENPSVILNVSEKPVLDIGVPGTFDENGVVPVSIVRVGSKLYLYYVGFQLGYKVRYFMFIGLAISNNGGKSFERYSKVPILDRTDKELLNRAGAFVMHNDLFQMWYVAGSNWITGLNGKLLPEYNMRYLESNDGMNWGKEGKVCINFKNEDEHGFGRPCVIREVGKYKMFYSIRTKSKGYRLGYAESKDGITWTRKDDEIGIDVSESGWDSQMISYPSVVRYRDRVYMFYCGNNCGETGFGYAVLKEW
ncbi:MAG: hypothetical protein NWE99_06520 [Candidatus Bathyarchaeota archaeon]|nr:hypothetical protein [Candidatus Bathyarchaeota archaeon]